VERLKHGEIDLERILQERNPDIVGLGLHWHFQAYDVIEVAKKIKQIRPDTPVVLGGFTATTFAEEILKTYDCVDFVIRGESEVPLLELHRQYRSAKAYDEVPNLSYRNGLSVKLNPVTYVADEALLESTCFTDFTLMKDYPIFVESFSRYMNITGLSESLQRRILLYNRKAYPVFLGRGCLNSCSYCGGGRESQVNICGRTCLSLRPVEAVAASLEDIQRFGFELVLLSYDPLPCTLAESFYLALFAQVKQRGIRLAFDIERWDLPTRVFIQAVRDTLPSGSVISLTLNSASEKVRKKNNAFAFDNQRLEECLAIMEEEGVSSLVFFAIGLPFETAADLQATADYQEYLRSRFKRVKLMTTMIELEPGSPLSNNPETFEVQLHRSTFADYYRYHSLPDRNHFQESGYDRLGCPKPEEVAEMLAKLAR